MSFPLFRNGKLLFCRDQSGNLGLATSCCSWRINISVPGWNEVHYHSSDVRIFKATQLFDSVGNLLENNGNSWTYTVTGPTTWRVGLKLKAWQPEYDQTLSPDDFSWLVNATVLDSPYSASLSGDMDGTKTDPETGQGNHDTSGGLVIYVAFDPSDGIHLTVSRTAPSSRASMLASLEQEMENPE